MDTGLKRCVLSRTTMASCSNVNNAAGYDQVERRLFQQQISMLARRYIRDLRREANVETR